jgi:hypothetical protein
MLLLAISIFFTMQLHIYTFSTLPIINIILIHTIMYFASTSQASSANLTCMHFHKNRNYSSCWSTHKQSSKTEHLKFSLLILNLYQDPTFLQLITAHRTSHSKNLLIRMTKCVHKINTKRLSYIAGFHVYICTSLL